MARSLPLAAALVAGSLAGAASPGAAQEDCGPYRTAPESAYVLEGDTLLLPGGGRHQADARSLRAAYGLQGPDQASSRTRFVDGCGQPYEVGYRIEGATLHLPNGGRHSLRGDPARAEATLREAYGLVGASEALARTRW